MEPYEHRNTGMASTATVVMDERQESQQFMKGPKRKRLAKACDACHKSKRRCDGTGKCNCYYASKQCTYTDASGRPVPAPRPFKSDRDDNVPGSSRTNPTIPPPPASAVYTPQFGAEARYPTFPPHPPPHPPQQHSYHNMINGYPSGTPQMASTSSQQLDHSEDERQSSRNKRYKSDRNHAEDTAAEHIPSNSISLNLSTGMGVGIERPSPVELDHGLTRELTNLFFTHCHPSRAIIHKPSFTTALAHNRVQSYLLHAVCALAAPLSKQPRIRTNPARNAGRPFAQEALSLMFDGAGRLVVDPNLPTAQALCLLHMHELHVMDVGAPGGGQWGSKYLDLALKIIENLGVHSPEHPTLTPVPSQEFIHASIERECIRRIFWLIYFMDVISGVYFKKRGEGWERTVGAGLSVGTGLPGIGGHMGSGMGGVGVGMGGEVGVGGTKFSQVKLRLRLPADETSFELAVHSTLPEYLYLQAVRTQYASEFGHLIRVITIYAKVEYALDLINDPETKGSPSAALSEAEVALDAWARSLSEHLQFTEQNLQVQLSMFETSSNMGAWCYCMIHVYHASTALGLSAARHRSQPALQRQEAQWAISRLDLIIETLGSRARNSLLLGAAIWSLVKYIKRDDPKIRQWQIDFEDFSAVKMHELARKEWVLVHSPQSQHLSPYTPSLQHHQAHTHPHQHPPPHLQHPLSHHPHSQHPHQQPYPQNTAVHRRLSEARPPQQQQQIPSSSQMSMPIPIPRAPPHQLGGDVSYNHRGRSPSDSPNAYPVGLGRSLDELRLHSGRGSGPKQGQDRERDKERDWDRERDREKDRVDATSRANGLGVDSGLGLSAGSTGDSLKDGRRIITDADIDPALQSGNGGSSGGGVGVSQGPLSSSGLGQRGRGDGVGSAGNADGGPQSLPSLKASGLLDSWNAGAAASHSRALEGQKRSGGSVSGSMQPPPPRRSPPAATHNNDNTMGATSPTQAPTGMPVGLQWLANE